MATLGETKKKSNGRKNQKKQFLLLLRMDDSLLLFSSLAWLAVSVHCESLDETRWEIAGLVIRVHGTERYPSSAGDYVEICLNGGPGEADDRSNDTLRLSGLELLCGDVD